MQGEMALLLLHLPFSSSSSRSSLPITIAAFPISRLMRTSVKLQPKSFNAFRVGKLSGVHERGSLIVRASSDIDGVGSGGGADPPEESKVEEAVPVENLPLESKLQLKLEAKLRMKLAKKIRLRRKRLVRKRRLRKKGRWPPSKMKKNKNV